MPVIAKQNQLDQLYEYQFQHAAADFAVYDTTVTNSVHQRLLLFRAHHHKCASRRRNALANEMRQESRRADWLRRKYVDSVRQQQQTHQQQVASSRLNQTTTATATGVEATTNGVAAASKGGGGLDTGMESMQHSEYADVKPFTNGSTGTLPAKTAGHPVSADNTATATEVHGPATGVTPVEIDTAVFIKREPDTLDYLSSASPCGDGRDMVAGAADFAAIKSDSEGQKRRLSFSLKADPSKWGSLCASVRDTRDDLKLTAYDVIAGVISTPPIKPLEPEGENTTSKLKPLACLTTSIATPSTTTATNTLQPTSQATSSSTTPTTGTTSCCTSLPKVSKEQHYLVHELDEFSKIMDEVAQEQTAMELAAAETVFSGHSHEPSLVSSYLSIPPSCPPQEISVPNNSFYQQKYPQVQAAQSPSQVIHQDYHHHHHRHHQKQLEQQQQHSISMSAECKSPLFLSGGGLPPGRLSVLSDLPSSSSTSSSSSQPVPSTPTTPLEHFSSSNQPMPPTPTTPLEHFSSFSSPPHSHLASSTAAHAGTAHLSTHQGISHLPSHQSTSHPLHPSASHNPLHPGNPHISAHPNTISHITPHPNTISHITPHPGTTSHVLPHPGTTSHVLPHPGTTSHVHPHPGTTSHIPAHPGTTSHITPHQCSPQQVVCQPYPAMPPHPFPYNHPPDTNSYQSPGSASVGDSWSLSAHRQQLPQVMGVGQGRPPPQITAASTSQGSLKDSILARVSSRVVAIAGQKRPPMLDLSGVPPSKMKGGGSRLDLCGGSAGGVPPPQYLSVTHHTPSPYETSTTPLSLSSVSFPSPHQHL